MLYGVIKPSRQNGLSCWSFRFWYWELRCCWRRKPPKRRTGETIKILMFLLWNQKPSFFLYSHSVLLRNKIFLPFLGNDMSNVFNWISDRAFVRLLSYQGRCHKSSRKIWLNWRWSCSWVFSYDQNHAIKCWAERKLIQFLILGCP